MPNVGKIISFAEALAKKRMRKPIVGSNPLLDMMKNTTMPSQIPDVLPIRRSKVRMTNLPPGEISADMAEEIASKLERIIKFKGIGSQQDEFGRITSDPSHLVNRLRQSNTSPHPIGARLNDDLINPMTGEMLYPKGTIINKRILQELQDIGIERLYTDKGATLLDRVYGADIEQELRNFIPLNELMRLFADADKGRIK